MSRTIETTVVGLTLIITAFSLISCTNREAEDHLGKNTMSPKTIEEVLKQHTSKLMSMPGVVGTAQGLCNDKPCVKVFVIRKTQKLEQKIHNILEGYPVVIQETGKIRALPENKD